MVGFETNARIWSLYKIVHKDSKWKYIGITSHPQKRFYQHKSNNRKCHLVCWLEKYRNDAKMIILLNDLLECETRALEMHMVPKSNIERKARKLLNDRGGRYIGLPRSEWTKEQVKKFLTAMKNRRGVPHSGEWNRKVGEAQKGTKNHRYGKTISEEHKKRLHEANQNHGAKTTIFINPNGIATTIYNMKKFCELISLDETCMGRVAKGKQKQHKGWKKS